MRPLLPTHDAFWALSRAMIAGVTRVIEAILWRQHRSRICSRAGFNSRPENQWPEIRGRPRSKLKLGEENSGAEFLDENNPGFSCKRSRDFLRMRREFRQGPRHPATSCFNPRRRASRVGPAGRVPSASTITDVQAVSGWRSLVTHRPQLCRPTGSRRFCVLRRLATYGTRATHTRTVVRSQRRRKRALDPSGGINVVNDISRCASA